MKVLQVIDSGGLYGAERILLALMTALGTEGVECTLASIAEPGLPEKALEAEARRFGLDVRRHTMASGPDRNATRKLLAEARSEGFDVFHTHGYKANTLIAGLPRRKRGLPAIATLHGWTATSKCSRVGIYEMVERQALRRADRVVAVSEAMIKKWRLGERYGARLRLIRNGIPLPETDFVGQRLPDNIQAFISGRRSIFAAGRFSREKGFDVLLEALAAVRAQGADVCLVLAGNGNERANLEAQAQSLDIEHAVLMPGYIDNARAVMGHFDLVAIPSRTEGLPVVLLESLMSGIPVAATAVGEMPTVMGSCDAGPYANPGDSDSLADLIMGILDHVEQLRFAEDSAKCARTLYSAEVMARAYLKLYLELSKSK